MNIATQGIGKIGPKIKDWQAWVKRWGHEGVSFEEQFGLIANGFEIFLVQGSADWYDRIAFYLLLANDRNLDEPESDFGSGRDVLAEHARFILGHKVFR